MGQYIFDNYLKPLSMPSGGSVVTQSAYRPASNETGAATGDPAVAQCEVVPLLYYEPVVYQYHPDIAILEPVVTYYVVTSW